MAPRKKARKSAAATDTSMGATGSASHVKEEAAADKPQTDRASVRRALRGRRGGLKDMPNMPLDILIEIFGFMHPRDLLNLARTSKDFRSFLMSRNSAPFWKAARQQLESLPDCPTFLSEPQYANLLFFSHCHNCLRSNIKSIVWEIYARYCQPCKDRMLIQDGYLGWSLLNKVRKETDMDGQLFTSIVLPRMKNSMYEVPFLHAPEFQSVKERWNVLTTLEDKKQFFEERTAFVNERAAPVDSLRAWKASETDARSMELESIKRARFEGVTKRLREEGWGDELDKMTPYQRSELEYHKAVRKAQKLTDTVWQSIRNDVIAHMERARQNRLDAERHDLLCGRLRTLFDVFSDYEASLGLKTPMSEMRAGFVDLAFMTPFRELVESPSDVEITRKDFEQLSDQIPTLMTKWFEEREREFFSMVQATAQVVDNETPLLSLAIVAFDCSICEATGLRWPNVLAHRCARTQYYSGDKLKMALTAACIRKKTSRLVWRGTKNIFSVWKGTEAARSVVLAASGRDPNHTTHDEMDQCDARLVCMACPANPLGGYKKAYSWREAADHAVSASASCRAKQEFEWMLLDNELTEKIRSLEQELMDKVWAMDAGISFILRPAYCCARCRYRGGGCLEHCKTEHNVANPQLNEDYYAHPDTRTKPRAVFLYPPRAYEGKGIHDIMHGLSAPQSIFE